MNTLQAWRHVSVLLFARRFWWHFSRVFVLAHPPRHVLEDSIATWAAFSIALLFCRRLLMLVLIHFVEAVSFVSRFHSCYCCASLCGLLFLSECANKIGLAASSNAGGSND
jgi:hypothetical protein